jgi:predicted NBD/HSP70 family sugar kinase
VSTLAESWIKRNVVQDLGRGHSTGGKPPVLLGVNPDAAYFIGMELGAAHLSAVLCNFRGETLASLNSDFPNEDDPVTALKLVESMVSGLLRRRETSRDRIVGLGVAVPSPLDAKNPDKLSELVLPKWADVPITTRLKELFPFPVFVDNDANLGALAEFWWGEHRDEDNLAFIKMAAGIGMGYIINGEIYHGATGVAGEIGHISMEPDGLLCLCGVRGCLNTLAGVDALSRSLSHLHDQYPRTSLRAQASVQEITQAALKGDDLARAIVQNAARYLGIAIGNMMNLFNPSRVILHGPLIDSGPAFWDSVRATAEQKTLWVSHANSRVDPASLGDQTVALGAATLVLKNALSQTELLSLAGRAQ